MLFYILFSSFVPYKLNIFSHRIGRNKFISTEVIYLGFHLDVQ